jgi:dienelactone hydrolase
MKQARFCWVAILLCQAMLVAQGTPQQVSGILGQQLSSSDVVSYQLQKYLMAHAPQLPAPASAKTWTVQAEGIRSHLLNDVILRGWPKAWVDSGPRFEDLGLIPSTKGYSIRKLRYEVVPGFWSAALLYEPENLRGPVPAVLNVTGHVGEEGKGIEYEQKRCANFALQGMVALSLEWLGQGELSSPENQHWYAGHLDLVGANGEGLFYLEMRRGLDYLYGLPTVDRERIGMTGLSGGGWQTMILGALDQRIKVEVPVAGYDALADWIPLLPGAAGDNEQAGSDIFRDQDYATLSATRAPKPTLLIYNAEDDCCFRAAITKPYVYDAIKPFFDLYGRADSLQFHENTDPSTHNYQLDNRVAAYRFFHQHFDMPILDREFPVDDRIKNYRELAAGLPKDNLTILSLARKFASEIKRVPIPTDAAEKASWADSKRRKLEEVVRYRPVTIRWAWALSSTKSKGVESLAYRFEGTDNLPAAGILIKAIASASSAPITIVLDDRGKKFAADTVSRHINNGEQVLALDLLFTGDDSTAALPNPWAYPEMVAAVGQRPLGIEAAELIALTHWIVERSHAKPVRVEASGMRMQIVALIAAAIEPHLFSDVAIHNGIPSLGYLLSKPVHYQDAADLFCLDLFANFDLDEIAALAGTGTVSYEKETALPKR